MFGVGHLMRSLALVHELIKDFDVLMVHGGEPIDAIRPSCPTVYLPPLRVFPGFPRLRPVAQDRGIDDILRERHSLLVALPTSFMPDVVVIESYPFGRTELAGELLPFLDVCRQAQIAVACSVRDILAHKPNQAEHDRTVGRILNEYFGAVLVHSDARITSLSDSFGESTSVRVPIHHTGYVVRPDGACREGTYCAELTNSSVPRVLVSVGGGRAGRRLLHGAIEAARLLHDRLPHHFAIHVGPLASTDVIDDCRRRAAGLSNVTLSEFIPCLSAHFRASALSISMGGYNTSIELLSTATPALVWPHDKHANQDQRHRCETLARLGAIEMLNEDEVHGRPLARRILAILNAPLQVRTADCDGAAVSRQILLDLARANILRLSAPFSADVTA
jgi:predicted glycosyltransferase